MTIKMEQQEMSTDVFSDCQAEVDVRRQSPASSQTISAVDNLRFPDIDSAIAQR